MTNLKNKDLSNLSENTLMLKKILDLSIKGLMIIDKKGIIKYVNESFKQIHNLKSENVIGKHVTKIIENTRMHLVAQLGVAERDEIQTIRGHEFVVSRIPIIDNNEIIGVIGLIRFEYTEQLKSLNAKVEKLERKLKEANFNSSRNKDTNFSFNDIIAISEAGKIIKEVAMRAAEADSTVLLLGESGVGKEVFAHSIHNMSSRNKGPFIRVNCSAIQENLFESELFGYEDGAFTGARKGGKKGKFELANGGTIFLDEIGDMPLHVQVKLLRVIQEREIDKLGGEKTTNIDVRIIAATNQNLEKLVEENKFRRDLYYRLNVIPIRIPSLRERVQDIPELVKKFWKNLQKKNGVYYKSLDYGALKALQQHNWPGNIRELQNVLERVISVIPQDTITENHIKTIIQGHKNINHEFCNTLNCNLTNLVEQTEREAISMALAGNNNNRTKAAKMLGISRSLLYKKMHYYNLE